MNIIILVPIILSFFITIYSLPRWIKKAKEINLLWEDMNKKSKEKVAGSGGTIVLISFIISTLIYVAIKIFYFDSQEKIIEILALLNCVLLLGVVGIIDDLFGWHKGGLSKRIRLLLCFIASIPLIVINAGTHMIDIPFYGLVNIGILYPLLIVPLAIAGTSTVFNFLAGFNGLEARQGIILIGSLSLVSYLIGERWISIIGLILISSLIAFLFFNKYPAKVFPGNVLTYPVGGMIAIMAILGNFEKITLFFFIPYFIEMILKLRGNLKKHSFGKPKKDGSLELRYDKIYSLNHIAIIIGKKIKPSHKVYEKDVVLIVNIIQLLFIIVGFVIFKNSLF